MTSNLVDDLQNSQYGVFTVQGLGSRLHVLSSTTLHRNASSVVLTENLNN